MNKFEAYIQEMEKAVLCNLSDLDKGYGRRKWAISKQTNIPIEILTAVLKRLRDDKKVSLLQIFSEDTGLASGRGYCLNEEYRKTLEIK